MTSGDGATTGDPTTGGTRPILRLTEVTVRIAGSHILHGIDFDVAEGGVTALLGRNGVGKSTTLKAILGIVASAGRIEFDGREITGQPTHRIVRAGIGYVPEDRDVFAGLTVAQNLELAQQPGVEAPAALHLVLVRHQLAVHEVPGRLHDGPLLCRECEVSA